MNNGLHANAESLGINVESLRRDDLDAFFALRAKTLSGFVAKEMSKRINNPGGMDVAEAFGMLSG